MNKIVIVGSGASGVHFALSLLKKGCDVLMLDVGSRGAETLNGTDSFTELKTNLKDPSAYFLGEDFSGVFFPDIKAEYYGIPPSKSYIFDNVDGSAVNATGFSPLRSFAEGGLAQAWTGGVYPFNDHELEDFPFNYKDIEPYYGEVARRIGISGVEDDLSRFMPVHENLLEPLKLDEHSALLLSDYENNKEFLNEKLHCYFGRARVTTLTRETYGRNRCTYLGRCLWGCPSKAFYTPAITLDECKKFSNFQYIPRLRVSHFTYNRKRYITGVVAKSLHDGAVHVFPLEKLVLAAGTLSSSEIFLRSIFERTGEIATLHGLMDNRQVLIPFLNLRMIGRPFDPKTYQYHQIAFGIEEQGPAEYLHGLVTTLKTSLIHPIIQKIPLDLRTAIFMFRNLHAALGLVNLNFCDTRRKENFVSLESGVKSRDPALSMNYSPRADEGAMIKTAVRTVKRVLWRLKCIVPPGMVYVRPMGASVHYSGTIPMSKTKMTCTTSEHCQSHDFDNLFIVDGTTFPFLPAKNITYTLMSNAVRIAERAF